VQSCSRDKNIVGSGRGWCADGLRVSEVEEGKIGSVRREHLQFLVYRKFVSQSAMVEKILEDVQGSEAECCK
jgi:hypothetical protein